jgi:hypothetical protein
MNLPATSETVAAWANHPDTEKNLVLKQTGIRNFLEKKPDKITREKIGSQSFEIIPIGTIQNQLDKVFPKWEEVSFSFQVIVNELVGVLHLRVWHAAYKHEPGQIMGYRDVIGCAAKQIKIVSGKPKTPENKITNALETDFPALKAECLKNAAKDLGPYFGRDLNRKATHTTDYAPLYVRRKEENAE